jgi:hypothetical protein
VTVALLSLPSSLQQKKKQKGDGINKVVITFFLVTK